ncbi:MAG: 4Fe-4S dicluster domain-containing protein [Candidatus Helarchaeota archaeon]
MPVLYKDEDKGKILFLQRDRCKTCNLCINICPNKALISDSELNKRAGYPPAANPESEKGCTFCQMCELVCPDFAIYVTKLELLEAET